MVAEAAVTLAETPGTSAAVATLVAARGGPSTVGTTGMDITGMDITGMGITFVVVHT